MNYINIIGSGLAGLSAAVNCAELGCKCRLISILPSERSQSVMAEGGINAALDTMGENDTVQEHFNDTIKGGVYLADPNAVWGLCRNAPDIVKWLCSIGTPLQMKGSSLILRNFGGQKKKRTAYAKSSTGKILMTSLIDEARKYENDGLIVRYPHHEFKKLILSDDEKSCLGVIVSDTHTGKNLTFKGSVILAAGGINSLFPGLTTGTSINTGDVAAEVFSSGVELANLEFIQYHPTTISIPNKRCLISEAARGEGGRLFVERDGKRWYFMEEKYPELKNLMPRDVVSREIMTVKNMNNCKNQVYLDMTEIDKTAWNTKLSDLRKECIDFLGKDPQKEPIEVSPAIHYFMGGIYVNEKHHTNKIGLYAAGECACQYHGANRLGGNSMLGAIYGGKVAAGEAVLILKNKEYINNLEKIKEDEKISNTENFPRFSMDYYVNKKTAEILKNSLGIFRNEKQLSKALHQIDEIYKFNEFNEKEKKRILLARAFLLCAINRKESRGANTREDYPNIDDFNYRKTTVVRYDRKDIIVEMREIPERRENDR